MGLTTYLISIAGEGGRHLLDGAFHENAADHAVAFAVPGNAFQSLDHQPANKTKNKEGNIKWCQSSSMHAAGVVESLFLLLLLTCVH